MRETAVVICTYNKKNYVLKCIESVLASAYTDFDLIIVDNASEDGSVAAIKAKYSDKLTLLQNSENLGGAGGFARGMQYAMDKEIYKYIHLLDDDIVVDKDAIGVLYNFMETHPQAGACGSLVYRMNSPEIVQHYGGMMDIENLCEKSLYRFNEGSGNLPECVKCDFVAACSAMYRTDALLKTGIIDKEYFIYWDDIALGLEIQLAGYEVYAYKKSKVWHCHGHSNLKSTFGIYYGFRNKIRCFARYWSDEDFAGLSENLVKRLFRTFAVNRNNPEVITTYLYALNDALNEIRGKADDFKILPTGMVNAKFADVFRKKTAILLMCETNDFDFNRLINSIKEVSKAEISVCPQNYSVPEIKGIHYADTPAVEEYDAIINICPHVLDVQKYDRNRIYIDFYMNQILDDDDFNFFENLDSNYGFFRTVFYGYIDSKLYALRTALRGVLKNRSAGE